MKKRIRIGIDLDGVLVDFSSEFYKMARKMYGDRMPVGIKQSEIRAWSFHDWYPITKEEEREVFQALAKVENFWFTPKPLDMDALDALRALVSEHRDQVDIYFITNRLVTEGETVLNQTIAWLQKFDWNAPQVMVTKDKGKMAKVLELDYFIDDNLDNVEDVYSNYASYPIGGGERCKVYTLDYLYNRGGVYADRIKRVKSLFEFIADIIEELKNE